LYTVTPFLQEDIAMPCTICRTHWY